MKKSKKRRMKMTITIFNCEADDVNDGDEADENDD